PVRENRRWLAGVASRRGLPGRLHLEGVSDHGLATDFISDINHVVALVRPDSPEAQKPSPRAQLLLNELAPEYQLAARDPEVRAELLGHPVDVDLERLAHARRQLHPPFGNHHPPDPGVSP